MHRCVETDQVNIQNNFVSFTKDAASLTILDLFMLLYIVKHLVQMFCTAQIYLFKHFHRLLYTMNT